MGDWVFIIVSYIIIIIYIIRYYFIMSLYKFVIYNYSEMDINSTAALHADFLFYFIIYIIDYK